MAVSLSGEAAATPEICATPAGLAFSMAYQPIVDVAARRTIAYEALVRGVQNQPASTVLSSWSKAPESQASRRDLTCGLLAIETASILGLAEKEADLFLNFSPNSIAEPQATLEAFLAAAARSGIPPHRLVLEITESEPLEDPDALLLLLGPYREMGVRAAIDDFGAGFAGLSLLAAFQPDIVKIDISLVREIHHRPAARIILHSIVDLCQALHLSVIAEGVEQQAQSDTLRQLGIHLMQGNLFGEPGFELLPTWPTPLA